MQRDSPGNCHAIAMSRVLVPATFSSRCPPGTRKAQGDAEELEDLADEVERLASLPPEARWEPSLKRR